MPPFTYSDRGRANCLLVGRVYGTLVNSLQCLVDSLVYRGENASIAGRPVLVRRSNLSSLSIYLVPCVNENSTRKPGVVRAGMRLTPRGVGGARWQPLAPILKVQVASSHASRLLPSSPSAFLTVPAVVGCQACAYLAAYRRYLTARRCCWSPGVPRYRLQLQLQPPHALQRCPRARASTTGGTQLDCTVAPRCRQQSTSRHLSAGQAMTPYHRHSALPRSRRRSRPNLENIIASHFNLRQRRMPSPPTDAQLNERHA